MKILALQFLVLLAVIAMVPELSPSGVPQSQVDVIVSIYQDGAEKLSQIVLHPPGGTETARQYNAARAAVQLRQITEIIQGLKADAAKWTGPALSTAIADGVARADAQAKAVGIRPGESPLAGSFGLIEHRTVAAFARDMHADFSKAADSMGKTAAKVLRETRQIGLGESQINRILAGGVITGQPVATIRALREELKKVHDDTVTIMDKNGQPLTFDTGYYAKLVAVTKTRQATVVARHERLSELGIDLVSIVGRISKNFCTAYLGMVFSISGNSTQYPALSSLPSHGPPFHPNCSKSSRPYVEALATEAQQKQAEGVADADQLIGVSAADAQRRYKDLQIHQAVSASYAHTANKLFGKAK